MKIYKRYFSFGISALTFLFFILILVSSCAKHHYPVDSSFYTNKSTDGRPDYSNLKYWAAHPWKTNPSDSIPKPLRKNYVKDSSADVFFIYPTTLTDYSDTTWNADIDDAVLNAKTDYTSILYQASVFNEACRIFAPRYRQAHLRTFYVPGPEGKKYFDTAYADIKNAFKYYLEHYNNGRPIIIASHSQGTLHAGRLLKEFFDGKTLQSKLICAYIIGLPVQEDYFSNIHPCSDAASTGCFVSWRTFRKGYESDIVKNENFKATVINPLTWTSTEGLASSELNAGGVLKKFNTIIPHVVNAAVHKNILWTSKPNVFGKFLLTQKNFHIGDINLFYMNIRQNVKTRIRAYRETNK